MTYYIEKNGTPIDNKEFASIADALNSARAPAWTGASPTEITIINETTYAARGVTYKIATGNNPKQARRDARSAVTSNPSRQYKGSLWLSREMDRADSDF